MKKYNPGTLIIIKNDYDHITYRGIILSLNECDSWWGGGYYSFLWTPKTEQGHTDNISFNQITEWIRNREAVVYTVE